MFAVTIDQEGPVIIVAPEGRLDTLSSARFSEELEPLLEQEDYLVIDLSECGYLASSGIRSLLFAAKKLGERTVSYHLRDWLISRQRYWGVPIPMINCGKCGYVPVPGKDLPVVLPTDVDFSPGALSPLLRVREFLEVKCPKCGGPARRETDTLGGYACSSRYFLPLAAVGNEKVFASRAALDYWLPVDVYTGGIEHARSHLLYARFWTKVLFDEGLLGFEELRALYEKADRDQAAEWAGRWTKQAEKVVEPTPEWLQKAGAVYLAMRELMKRHGTDSITANCLGGFASGQLPAYPCLGFMQILDEGGLGVCEAMPDDSVSMLMARILTGRPGYVSDPALDTSKNQIVYSHCMAMTKVFGSERESCRFRIRTLHNRDPRGCCPQSFLPEGFLATTFRTNVGRKQMVIHRVKTVGNLDSEFGCRTQLLGEVCGDIGKLFHQWDRFGWHRVTVYGDVQEPLVEFGRALGLEIIQEA